MSGELSNVQKNSLAGKILLKLGVTEEGKIDRQKWNSLWEANTDYKKGKPETNELVDGDDIDVQDAFKYIMTRIFNAAKSKINNEKWDANGADKNNAINEVANKLLKNADSIKTTDTIEDEEENDEEELVTTNDSTKASNNSAQQALNNATEQIKTATGNSNAAKSAIDNANKSINKAMNAESLEKAEVEIKKAEAEIETAKAKIKEAEIKANEAQEELKSVNKEQDCNNVQKSLETAVKAIGSYNIQIENLEISLKQTKDAIRDIFGIRDAEQKQRPKTIDDLNDIKASFEQERLINGTKQRYYKYKFNDETVRAIETETGELDELIEISDNKLKKKEFITVSQLQKATNNKDITQLPDGISCECKIEDEKVVLTFKDKNGLEIEASKVPNYPENIIDDTFRNQLKAVNTGIKQLPASAYQIQEDGTFSLQTEDIDSIVDTSNSDFSNINHTVTQDEKGFLHKGIIKVVGFFNKKNNKNALNRLNSFYQSYIQQLSIQGEVYKSLSQKAANELTDGEKAFMKKYEIEAYKFLNVYK